MTRWYRLDPVGAEAFSSAPLIYRFPVRLAVPPARVWESLASERSVSDWGLFIQSLTWTSPRPFGVSSTREVVLAGKAITVREQFFRWDEGSGYSFRAREANRPGLRALAEDYVVEPDGDGALFTWTIAIEATPPRTPAMKHAGPLTRLAFGQLVRGAKSYFAEHP